MRQLVPPIVFGLSSSVQAQLSELHYTGPRPNCAVLSRKSPLFFGRLARNLVDLFQPLFAGEPRLTPTHFTVCLKGHKRPAPASPFDGRAGRTANGDRAGGGGRSSVVGYCLVYPAGCPQSDRCNWFRPKAWLGMSPVNHGSARVYIAARWPAGVSGRGDPICLLTLAADFVYNGRIGRGCCVAAARRSTDNRFEKGVL